MLLTRHRHFYGFLFCLLYVGILYCIIWAGMWVICESCGEENAIKCRANIYIILRIRRDICQHKMIWAVQTYVQMFFCWHCCVHNCRSNSMTTRRWVFFRGFFLWEDLLLESIVAALPVHQFLVGPLFLNSALHHHNNLISSFNRLQAVSDHQ